MASKSSAGMHTKSTPVMREVASSMVIETLADRETHRSARTEEPDDEHQQRRTHSLLLSMCDAAVRPPPTSLLLVVRGDGQSGSEAKHRPDLGRRCIGD